MGEQGFEKSNSALLQTVSKYIQASCEGPEPVDPFDDQSSKLVAPAAAVPDHVPAVQTPTATAATLADAMSAATKLQALSPYLACVPLTIGCSSPNRTKGNARLEAA